MYEWDFGDGTKKSGKITNHTFRSDGPYTIQLTVIDNDGLRSDSRSSVTVIPTPKAHPIAEMSCSPKDIQEGQTVSCNATNSYDPDGTISMYEWDFGDGTIKSGKITNHTYRSDGPYTIQLTVIDNDGLRSDSRSSVTVIPTPKAHPIAEMSCSPKDIQEGQTVSCNATNSYDPDGTISMYEWDFGDGTIKSGKITNHTYRSDGPYTIQLTVIDNDGLRSDSRSSVTVIPTPKAHPIAEMSCSPKDIQEGQTVSCNATNSYDPDGTISMYEWDFGDGTIKSGKITNHTYRSDGPYTIQLTVIDNDGLSDSVSHDITVNPPPLELPDLFICKVDVTGSKVTVCNIGTASVPAKEFHIAWSQSWYTKPGWNSVKLVNYPDPVSIPVNGQKEFVLFGEIDVGTEFMVDAVNNKIKESNETNNCVNTKSNVIPCRQS